jgi:hypothetical protein
VVVHNPFHQSVATTADLTGIVVSKRSVEEMLRDAVRDSDAFYQQRYPDAAIGVILVGAVDGQAPLGAPQPSVGLTEGQKANRKENGNRGYRVHALALGAHSATGRRESVPYSPPIDCRLPRAQRTGGCGPVCSKASCA